ncbi:MAG: BMP family lipoprotein [Ilumatobacteraceae bacterium]
MPSRSALPRRVRRGTAATLAASVLLLTACTSDNPSSGVMLGVALDVGATGRGTVNDAVADGAEAARDDLDLAVTVLETVDNDARPLVVSGLVEDGANPVVVVGSGSATDLADIAALHPTTSFVLVGGTFEGVLDSTPVNVRTVTFAEQEGAFMMGAAAALACGCQRLGFIGGQENAATRRYEAGFVAGAQHVVANIPVDVRYLGSESDPLALASPDVARDLALEMYAAGVGAVFTVAGASDAGVVSAAVATGRWALAAGPDVRAGLDDESADRILTSMVTRVDLAVYDAARDYLDGQFTGGDIVAGLSSGWLTWSTEGGHLDAISDQLEQLGDLVASGAVAVPSTP